MSRPHWPKNYRITTKSRDNNFSDIIYTASIMTNLYRLYSIISKSWLVKYENLKRLILHYPTLLHIYFFGKDKIIIIKIYQ